MRRRGKTPIVGEGHLVVIVGTCRYVVRDCTDPATARARVRAAHRLPFKIDDDEMRVRPATDEDLAELAGV